ncbi:T9SS type A sorting domain-containing protein [Flavobacterium lipolyticum]|uniref:T9SS type A sorting domain-containing protein n=1 Tax=Flavobacterium lipolyticum TaxID=2893754 RepID=A0ABS8LWX3_9FLAO|nr:T9SS type A sorting domain-containing protein [Flavobacterium sp. F-126]MCC9017066.1 T9SS type A sorting domain-containing protein [Flavobacterium sp. F-126]
MKKITLSFLFLMLFFIQLAFCQGSVKYDSKTKSIDVASGVEGTASILVKFYGSTESTPIFLETMSCGNTDGFQLVSYSKGSIMNYYQNETNIVFKFKKTVSSDTQVIYKFSTNGSCFQNEADMIKITVNYKATVTNPTNPTFDNQITIFHNYKNTIISDLSIDRGSTAPLIGGTFVSLGYEYQWDKKNINGVWMPIPGETKDFILPGILLETTQYRRSAKKTSSTMNVPISNVVTITLPHVPAIENNIISISGTTITGSQPTGAFGDYKYSWFLGSQEDPIIFDETTKDLDLTPYWRAISILQNDHTAFILRTVQSVNSSHSSNSNKIRLYGTSQLQQQALKAQSEEDSLLIYPNPTTEVVNFATNFSTNKEIEIVVYSESTRNERSVFKGTVTPNQVVSWNIPSGYAKGIYFYKIRSGSKEVKTGKIIVQ